MEDLKPLYLAIEDTKKAISEGNRELAEKFRREVLEKGGSEHPMALYKKFMGRKPKTDALLRRNGIIK